MSVNVYIPTPFRHLVGNRASISATGDTVRDVLGDLDAQFPGFRAQVVDQSGEVARHINIYVNQVEIENLQGESTKLNNGDEIAVIPALAGGANTALTRRDGGALQPPPDHAAGRQRRAAKDYRGQRARSSVRAASDRRWRSTSHSQAWARSASSISMLSTVRTCSARSSTRPTTSGSRRSISAKETLLAHNPNVNVVTHEAPITSDNAFEFISQYDMVVNGADNFATRYLVNDACYLLKKPLIDGSHPDVRWAGNDVHPGQGLLPLPLSRAAPARAWCRAARKRACSARCARPSAASRRPKC